jgi:hypothetical protein
MYTRRPATSLPWIEAINDEEDCYVYTKDAKRFIAQVDIEQDCSYIVHACNYYPMLIVRVYSLISCINCSLDTRLDPTATESLSKLSDLMVEMGEIDRG